MSRSFQRGMTAVAAGVAAGVVTAFMFVLLYAIANLYLSGHSIKPSWFDAAADVLLPLSAGSAALLIGAIAWRTSRSS
jgi:hypothetical protein